MKKIKILLFSLGASVLALAALFWLHCFDGLLFEHMAERFFVRSVSSDALSLHFTLAKPEAYGIRLENPSLPVYSRRSQELSRKEEKLFLDRLLRLRPDRLSEESRYTYELLTSYLALELEGGDFPYYEEPLSPSSGMQSELLLLLAEYTLRSARDAEDYLSILASVPAYLEGLSAYEKEKSEAGLFMTDADAEAAAAQCSAILDAQALREGSHFLQTTFASRLEPLTASGELTDAQRADLLARNDRLLTDSVLPAYERLAAALRSLSGSGLYSGGLAERPDGRAYYSWLVRRSTGSSLDPEKLSTLLQKTFQKKYSQMKAVLAKYRELTGTAPELSLLSEAFPLTEPDAILTDLQQRMAADFPSLGALSDTPISCTVKDVDSALEAYTSPAFYMTPPLDSVTSNTICINRSSTSAGLELYTTLAHEGYPGHLYQSVYAALSADQRKVSPVRRLLFYGGYMEGWAYYTEQLSYSYAADLLQNAASGSAASLLCQLISLQRDLQINLFSLLDISLHYDNASQAEILRSLESFGLPADTSLRIYDYLRTSPAAYLKYYVGYLEMSALRERARAQWGEAFSPERFHRFVLEAGPSDYASLTKRLRAQ
ncbi:MAG: DUF885 domain-containing protein [Eubacteriales bacterium]|nr:DUF885 domain-containing protein [Eubacteriales bacterium]